jgi:superfamily II DNA helicase RecQ
MPWVFYEQLNHRPIAAWQSGGVSRRLDVGALLRLSSNEAGFRRAISQSVVYGLEAVGQAQPIEPRSLAALQAIEAIVTRSELVPVAPGVEQCICDELAAKFGNDQQARFSAEQTISLAKRWCANRRVPPTGAPLTKFDDEPDGSNLERRVWEYLQTKYDGRLRAWVHPQPYFGSLLREVDDKRADFVVCPPGSEPLVWEVHGKFDPHDRYKSTRLKEAGWEVFDQMAGVTSKRAVDRKIDSILPVGDDSIADWESFLIDAAWVASQVELVLSWLVATGRLGRSQPLVVIEVDSKYVSVAREAIAQWTSLVCAVEAIWGLEGDSTLHFPELSITVNDLQDGAIRVVIDPAAATYIAAEQIDLGSTYAIRRACFPIDLGWTAWCAQPAHSERLRPSAPPPEDALLHVLRRVFGKENFRPGQLDAVRAAVTHDEALILFPTGYGKSLVFQMAAFLLPGITLVIEPFRALLDDQERNLQDLGISRIASIHSGKALARGSMQWKLADAQMIYVAAERLHVSDFIARMVELVRSKGLSLFIVDEAHVVSQFGHSFRPAYLDLAERVDAICGRAGRKRPTVLALTATAAQRVMRDIQALLRISGDPISLEDFASNSFVRENMTDEIADVNVQAPPKRVKSDVEAAERQRRSVLEQVASALDSVPSGQGIVFCPSKGEFKPRNRTMKRDSATGRTWWAEVAPLFGARGICDELRLLKGPDSRIGLYSGGSDDDDARDRDQMARDASAFSQGLLDIMVSTSAFGTGVDLQGVRWTLHIGMPGGLEAYYQESGRAGRDGSGARNVLLVDWDSAEIADAMSAAMAEEDPIASLQSRLGKIERRGSIARQLGLLIGDGPPEVHSETLKDPVWLRDDRGEIWKSKSGRRKYAFKASFPGWRWEAKHVDREVHCAVLKGDRSKPIEVWCHQWWQDLVWKSIYRLALLGVVKHGFEHTPKRSDSQSAFVVERSHDENLDPELLLGRVEAEIARFTSIERALEAREALMPHLATAPDKARRLELCSGMLLKSVYKVVYETRIASLQSLVRYAKQPSLQGRRDIIEDYFRPSDLKRQIFALCSRAVTPSLLTDAIAVAEAQPRWRSAIYEVAATEFPGSAVPQILLSIGGIKAGDAQECARQLFQILADTSLSLDLRGWCFQQITMRARAAALLQTTLDGLAMLMREAMSFDTLETFVSQLEDADGCSGFGHRLVADFVSMGLEKRT